MHVVLNSCDTDLILPWSSGCISEGWTFVGSGGCGWASICTCSESTTLVLGAHSQVESSFLWEFLSAGEYHFEATLDGPPHTTVGADVILY